MNLKLFALVLGFGLLVEGTVFALYYDDLLYLRRPTASITDGSREAFATQAEAALERETLTRAHLDKIADAARSFGNLALEVRALNRRLALDPDDAAVQLRLADALRRDGEFERAGALFQQVLEATQ
jgi:tetratricopeptide (TPR) repeat protein